jgi:tRNA-specific 2-thiouridylase
VRGTTNDQTIVVALSGGVDSAVAAARLVEQAGAVIGMTVIAMTLRLRSAEEGRGAVPSPEAIEGARAVSRQLDIPFYVVDAREAFQRDVVDYFIAEYAAGRTPNPCVRCNRVIRFGLLMERALELGADALATGHYARIHQVDGTYRLLRGTDPDKDQSYFLHALNQEQLAHTRFPLGHTTKDQVREWARKHDLPVAGRAESQDVCFLTDGDYRTFLEEQAPEILKPGPVLDTAGRVLGEHRGLAAYTIGQRKGLNVPASDPLYVLVIRPEENAIVVGTADELGRDRCLVEDMHTISGESPRRPFHAQAQIRYRARPTPVTVNPLPNDRAEIQFSEPQRDITPGQFLVLYRGDVVLGGGTICEAQNSML